MWSAFISGSQIQVHAIRLRFYGVLKIRLRKEWKGSRIIWNEEVTEEKFSEYPRTSQNSYLFMLTSEEKYWKHPSISWIFFQYVANSYRVFKVEEKGSAIILNLQDFFHWERQWEQHIREFKKIHFSCKNQYPLFSIDSRQNPKQYMGWVFDLYIFFE